MWVYSDFYHDDKKSVVFRDRKDAGKRLAQKLASLKGLDIKVYALPRGGVPVAYEVAKYLNKKLNVVISRKITPPNMSEYAIGAVSELESFVFDPASIELLGGIDTDKLQEVIDEARVEIKRRVAKYRNNEPIPDLGGKTVIVIDDGLATGMSALAAAKTLRKLNAKNIIYASPVCSVAGIHKLHQIYDKVICYSTPKNLRSISEYYDDFRQLTDKEVMSYITEKRTV